MLLATLSSNQFSVQFSHRKYFYLGYDDLGVIWKKSVQQTNAVMYFSIDNENFLHHAVDASFCVQSMGKNKLFIFCNKSLPSSGY